MDNLIFSLPKRKYVGDSQVVSLRVPKDLVEDVDSIAKMTGRTRNEVLQLCLEFSLAHLEVPAESEEKIRFISEKRPFCG